MQRSAFLAATVLVAGCQSTKPEGNHRGAAGSPRPEALRDAQTSATPPAADRKPVPPLPDLLPGRRTDVTAAIGSAWRVAIADVDGERGPEIIAIDSKTIRLLDAAGRELATAPVPGGILQLRTADLDGDGRAEAYAGWGQTRDHMNAQAKVTVHRLERGKLVAADIVTPTTTRPEITAIVPMPDTRELFVAYFDSKYLVSSLIATRAAQGWTTRPVAQIRTATSYARGDVDGDGSADLVVGRVYGDDKGIDGDAFVLAPDGSRTTIPSTRGVRSMTVTDADGDGSAEIFMGDGWHQNYGQHARGLLTVARRDAAGFTTELVEDTPGQYEIMRSLPATIDGRFVLVAHGSHYVRVFWRTGTSWTGLTIGGAARDIAVGDLDGKPGDEILIAGDKSEVIALSGALP